MHMLVFVPVYPAVETLKKKCPCCIWCSCPLLDSGGRLYCLAPTGHQKKKKAMNTDLKVSHFTHTENLSQTSLYKTHFFLNSVSFHPVKRFSETTASIPASWPSCLTAHASVVQFLHVWPAVLGAGLQPSCDAVQNLLCLVSESSARSADLSAHSPRPAWLSPPTPCSAGEAHMRHVTRGLPIFV